MIRGAVRNPHLVAVLCLMVAVLGVTLFGKIPADLLPVFETPAVQIVTFYPGMPPEVMERDIMSRLERWTGQSVGIEHQEAKAMLGVTVVKDFFREGISLDTAMSQVTSYAMSDLFYLPPGTVPPMVMPFDPTASVPLALVTVSTVDGSLSEKELYDVAYFQLRNNLQSISGVIAPAVYGGTLRRILAYVDPVRLAARHLTPMDVVRALRRGNVLVPAGNAKLGDRDWQIFTNAIPERVEDLDRVPIRVVDGHMVLLGDVGRVRDTHQIQSNIVRINGSRQVYIPIYRQPGSNTIQIVDSIQQQLQRILSNLRESDPKAKSLVLQLAMDQSGYVRQSIRGLELAAGLGALLAALVVLVFLRDLRLTFTVLLAIPISVLAAILGLYATGRSLNAMTLGGMALAVGILVDQSIVVLDNITRHLAQGRPPREAAIEGAREVALPVFVSTLTFVFVFFPVLYLTGIARYLFTPLALAAGLSIAASFCVALGVIPTLCARLLRPISPPATDPQGPEDAAERPKGNTTSTTVSAGGFRGFLRGVVRWRIAVVVAVVVAFAGSVWLLVSGGHELFPKVDARQFMVQVRLPSGTRIEHTERAVAEVERIVVDELGAPDPEYPRVERHPGSHLKLVISNLGVLMDWPAAYTPNTGPMDAFVLVQLKNDGSERVFDVVDRLRKKVHAALPEADLAFNTGGMLSAALNLGEPAPIHFQVSGSKLDTGLAIARELKAAVDDVPGIRDVRVAQRLDYPMVKVDVDRVKAAYVGASMESVVKNLVASTNSSVNFDPAFWIDRRNGNHYFLGVQYPEKEIRSLETLLNVQVGGAGGARPVPLRQVATVTPGLGRAVVNHRNITRVIDLYADVAADRDVGRVLAACERRIRALPGLGLRVEQTSRGERYQVHGQYEEKGYRVELQGEMRTLRSAARELVSGLLIALGLIYLAMVAQLRSFVDPLVILLTVPLGFIGVAVVLRGTGMAVSVPVLMGIVLMAGTVVEYTIILLEFANRLLRERPELGPGGAIVEAAAIRLRPVAMAALTTVLAISPMAFGLGGGDANVPLAATIVGGVTAAAALTLLVTPCLYVLLKRTRAARS